MCSALLFLPASACKIYLDAAQRAAREFRPGRVRPLLYMESPCAARLDAASPQRFAERASMFAPFSSPLSSAGLAGVSLPDFRPAVAPCAACPGPAPLRAAAPRHPAPVALLSRPTEPSDDDTASRPRVPVPALRRALQDCCADLRQSLPALRTPLDQIKKSALFLSSHLTHRRCLANSPATRMDAGFRAMQGARHLRAQSPANPHGYRHCAAMQSWELA